VQVLRCNWQEARERQDKCFNRLVLVQLPHGRRRAEGEAQRLLAAIVESSEDAVFACTPECIILTWNRGAEGLLGFTAEQAIVRCPVLSDDCRTVNPRLPRTVPRPMAISIAIQLGQRTQFGYQSRQHWARSLPVTTPSRAAITCKNIAIRLAAPTTQGFDLVAWIAPFAVFAAALLGTILLIRRWSVGKTQAPAQTNDPATEALREKIRRETGSDGGF